MPYMSVATCQILKENFLRMRSATAELQDAIVARNRLRTCRAIRRNFATLRMETETLRRAFLLQKAGFKEDQPRWPAGSGDVSGRWSGGAGNGRVEVTTSPGFITGDSIIDNTSEALSNTLVRVMKTSDFIPESSPQIYGIAVHAAFATAVRLQNLPGVGYYNVERSFSLDDADPRYGLAGTIRTDVALENDQGEVIAIYDVKTGERELSAARAAQLRQMTRAGSNTPVFELNINRGITRKYMSLSRFARFVRER